MPARSSSASSRKGSASEAVEKGNGALAAIESENHLGLKDTKAENRRRRVAVKKEPVGKCSLET